MFSTARTPTKKLPMTANELASSFFTLFEGQPSGREISLPGGIETYVAEPSGQHSSAGIILVSDHEGWKSKKVRLYADKFAQDGKLAVVPDLFHGDNPPLKELKDASKGDRNTLQAWAERHPEEQVLSDIEKLLEGLRGVYHIENFGAIGFCIGALHSALLAGGSQVKAAVLNHGRNLRSSLFENAQQPMLVNWAQHDDQMPPQERDQYRQTLDDMVGTVPSDTKVFEGTEHGFTLQAGPGSERDVDLAYSRANDWFSKYL